MGDEVRWAIRPTVISIIGLAGSIVLSVGLLLLGVDRATSVLIGIGTTTLSLLIDLSVRIEQSEKAVITAGGLSDQLLADQRLFDAIRAIAADYRHVMTTSEFDIFRDRAGHALDDC